MLGKETKEMISWGTGFSTIEWEDSVSITGYARYRHGNKEYPILIFTTMSKGDFENAEKRTELLWSDAEDGIGRLLDRATG